MPALAELHVTLPAEVVERVRAKITSGQYASESEMIEEGLAALQERDQTVDDWLRQEVTRAADALEADPASGLDIEAVRAGLRSRHQKALKSRQE